MSQSPDFVDVAELLRNAPEPSYPVNIDSDSESDIELTEPDDYGEELKCSEVLSASPSHSPPQAGGSTIPQPVRDTRHRAYCITINNPLPLDEQRLLDLKVKCKAMAAQYERGDRGTVHIQAAIWFKEAQFFSAVKRWLPTAHIEPQKGTWQQNVDYCSKEQSRVKPLILYNAEPTPAPFKPYDFLEYEPLYDWQQEIVDLIAEPPHPRQIHWYFDNVGNKGKSTLAKHLCLKYGALFSGGKGHDIKYMVQQFVVKHGGRGPRVVIWDIPRSEQTKVDYGCVEEIKNGLFFSGKYEGDMCIFDPPHVLIFSNSPPPFDQWSADRLVRHDL